LIRKKREIQRQWEENKILETKYNRRYKEIKGKKEGVDYLRKENLEKEWKGDEIRALIKS